MTTIRQLTIDDYRSVLDMQTGIEDDYVIGSFPQLIENPAQSLFGLMTEEGLAAVAGVYRLPNGNGILGRLRSDIRYQSKGNATALLKHIIAYCEQDPRMNWLGAITRKSNLPAQRVLDKLNMRYNSQFISLLMENPGRPSFLPLHHGSQSKEPKRSAMQSNKQPRIQNWLFIHMKPIFLFLMLPPYWRMST